MTCKPTKPSVPFSSLSPCEQLAVVTDGLFALASGKTKVIVRHGEYWVEYGKGNVPFLERERARLERLCDQANGVSRRRAITIGRTRCF